MKCFMWIYIFDDCFDCFVCIEVSVFDFCQDMGIERTAGGSGSSDGPLPMEVGFYFLFEFLKCHLKRIWLK